MKDWYIYKITREDGKQYIGSTNDIEKRMYAHSYTKRFKNISFTVEVLFITKNVEELYAAEEFFIKFFDTYRNGLNETKNGRGNHSSPSFTTLGIKMKQRTKDKISKKLKGKKPWNKGKKHKDSTKEKLRETRKGKIYHPTKFSKEDIQNIRNDYKNEKYIEEFANIIGTVGKNGKIVNYKTLFSKKYAEKYNVSSQSIRQILDNKSWTVSKFWNE